MSQLNAIRLKRTIHDKEKLRRVISDLMLHLYRQTDQLRAFYKAVTGECHRRDCTSERKCFDCREEERSQGFPGLA